MSKDNIRANGSGASQGQQPFDFEEPKRSYSDLEVVHNQDYKKFELARPPHSDLEAVVEQPSYIAAYLKSTDPVESNDSEPKSICGLRKKLFILVVIGIILAIAVVGGVVGGILGSKHSKSSSTPPSTEPGGIHSSSISVSAITATPIITTITTTMSSSATATTITLETGQLSNGTTVVLSRDCPSSNYTQYSTTAGGATYLFTKVCDKGLLGTGTSETAVNVFTTSLNDCIEACANANAKSGVGKCTGVCWRNGFNNDFPGQCFGYLRAANATTGGFSVQNEAICDAAAWVNQP